jgi:oligopeptidase A
MNNPLLSTRLLPAFSNIRASHVTPAIQMIIERNKKELKRILKNPDPSWGNLIYPLELMDNKLHRAWSIVSHLNAVKNTPAWRKAMNKNLPILIDYYTEMEHNQDLFKAVKQCRKSQAKKLKPGQIKILDDRIRDFKLSGAELNIEDKKQFSDLQKQHSLLTTKFEENLMDSTDAWEHIITNPKDLSGIPEHALSTAKEAARKKKKKGYLFNLQFPSYSAILTYAKSRKLRERFYRAYVTRASKLFKDKPTLNNDRIMVDIINTRQSIAKLLGFEDYTGLSLSTKMAKSSDDVSVFLQRLAKAARLFSQRELHQLKQFACDNDRIKKLCPWDIAYYSEKLKKQLYQIDQELLRPYFPEDKVLSGLFTVATRLYKIQFKEIKSFDAWHKDIRLFQIKKGNKAIAYFYLDLYARANKRGGAWMDDCCSRFRKNNKIQLPVAYLVCNFNPPSRGKQAIFTHDDVITLFHEFGHGLQHMLTQVDHLSASGIQGVPWDAVELPSQFMENYCWQEVILPIISEHHESKAPLPRDYFNSLLAAKNFQAGLSMLRQIEFSLFDMKLHQQGQIKDEKCIQKILDQVRADVSITPQIKDNRFQNSFSHIFAGGYAAGYYSYKWAEVLSSDAFSLFEQNGLFDHKTSRAFLKHILQPGGSCEAMKAYVAFRGREPKLDALLKHSGLVLQ